MILLTEEEISSLCGFTIRETSIMQVVAKAQLKKVKEWIEEHECSVTTPEYLLFQISLKDWQDAML